MKTIDAADLATVTGGNALSHLMKKIGNADLTPKQIHKLDARVDKMAGKKHGTIGAIAPGDFGAPASSFVPITGD
jgi:hypothetical protein